MDRFYRKSTTRKNSEFFAEDFGNDGALAGLKEARRRGQVRFLGVRGHYQPEHIAKVLASGDFDIIMAPFHYGNRFIYRFKQEILPVAAKYDSEWSR